MTVEQRQCLLCYLGYYKGAIDGRWGTESILATERFQNEHNLACDGIWGPKTEANGLAVISSGDTNKNASSGDWWDEIKYFSKKEFKCKCGGKYCSGYPAEIDRGMVKIADAIRERLDKPLGVNSGLRCQEWNRIQGGVSDSQHRYGTAVDLGKPEGVTPAQMAKVAEDIMGNTGGIGIYSWGIHIDTRKTKSRWNG